MSELSQWDIFLTVLDYPSIREKKIGKRSSWRSFIETCFLGSTFGGLWKKQLIENNIIPTFFFVAALSFYSFLFFYVFCRMTQLLIFTFGLYWSRRRAWQFVIFFMCFVWFVSYGDGRPEWWDLFEVVWRESRSGRSSLAWFLVLRESVFLFMVRFSAAWVRSFLGMAGGDGGGPLGLLLSVTILVLIGILAFSIRLFSVSWDSSTFSSSWISFFFLFSFCWCFVAVRTFWFF